jgi:hypothetical protein
VGDFASDNSAELETYLPFIPRFTSSPRFWLTPLLASILYGRFVAGAGIRIKIMSSQVPVTAFLKFCTVKFSLTFFNDVLLVVDNISASAPLNPISPPCQQLRYCWMFFDCGNRD